MSWTARPTLAPGEYPDGAEIEAFLDAIERCYDPYRAIATRATNQSVSTATVTDVSFTTEEEDVGGLFAATSTSITLNVAGTWVLTGGLVFATNATGIRACLMVVNGAANYQDGSTSLPAVGSAADVCRMAASAERLCAAGDVITLAAYQTSGGALNVQSARLSARLVAAAS